MTIREYTKNDIEKLSLLWVQAFEDPIELPKLFFDMLPNMGSCVVGEESGEIVAMASVIAGQELQFAKSLKKPEVGYIYAVAVEKNHRGKGYGKEISKAAYDLAIKREAMIISTLPASSSLYNFYSDVLNFKTALYRKKVEVEAKDVEMTMKCSSTEYYMMKEGLLSDKTFLRLSNFAMEFEKKLCELFGGGLYASMSGICSAYVEDNICYIHDMISQNPANTAASIAHTLNCKKAIFYLPSEDKNDIPFIMSNSDMIPCDAIWNIAYE